MALGLVEIAGNAGGKALLGRQVVGLGGDHHYRRVVAAGDRLQAPDQVLAVHVRKHQRGGDPVELLALLK
jgi:hypothetical protein